MDEITEASSSSSSPLAIDPPPPSTPLSSPDNQDPFMVILRIYDASPRINPFLRLFNIAIYRSVVYGTTCITIHRHRQYVVLVMIILYRMIRILMHAVHRREIAFIPTGRDGAENGITESQENQRLDWCKDLKLSATFYVGETRLEYPIAIRNLLNRELFTTYGMNMYNHITRNCHHFADRLCFELTGNPNAVPSWVDRSITICKISLTFLHTQ